MQQRVLLSPTRIEQLAKHTIKSTPKSQPINQTHQHHHHTHHNQHQHDDDEDDDDDDEPLFVPRNESEYAGFAAINPFSLDRTNLSFLYIVRYFFFSLCPFFHQNLN
eukprot:TRINITY_DN13742_c0_g1_i2.p2 TRINITY_DN13742_c0_g1~~TRINITY_DN13742_c0_g1_i2.p2  ORF type:complete len:120 (+),score=24.50 TRINITY_DN13742_c0_g1_i2:40-360(+)